MAIFYNWQNIVKHYKGNIYKIAKAFVNRKYREFPGDSFILNPEPLLALPALYHPQMVEYIELASIRNYFDAEYLHNARLSTFYVTPEQLTRVPKNRLLKIVGKEILFYYEEQYGNQVW